MCAESLTSAVNGKITISDLLIKSTHKARYRLMTKSTVTKTSDKSTTKSTVADTFDFVTNTVNFVANLSPVFAIHWRQSRIQQLVVVNTVANSVDFVTDTVDSVS